MISFKKLFFGVVLLPLLLCSCREHSGATCFTLESPVKCSVVIYEISENLEVEVTFGAERNLRDARAKAIDQKNAKVCAQAALVYFFQVQSPKSLQIKGLVQNKFTYSPDKNKVIAVYSVAKINCRVTAAQPLDQD